MLFEHKKNSDTAYNNIIYNSLLFDAANSINNLFGRINGNFSFKDSVRNLCYSELPYDFLRYGCMIPHPFGITLSVDEIGSCCAIYQNATVSTNGDFSIGENTDGYKPRIGNCVSIYAGSVISGKINIGDFSIISSNSVVTKDVPPYSIVYGVNEVRELKSHHYNLLEKQLWHCENIYKLLNMKWSFGELHLIDFDRCVSHFSTQ